jgi:hypothetical protein
LSGLSLAPCFSAQLHFHEEEAQPVATANGSAEPWLISNVRQRMKRLIAIVVLLVFSGCHTGIEFPMVYGAPALDSTGEAKFSNSENGERSFKDVFVISKVDGREVILSPKPSYSEIAVRGGRHRLELRFQSHRGWLNNAVRAVATIEFNVMPGEQYRVSGKVEDKFAILWIEDVRTGTVVTERVTAPVVNFPDFDPLIPPYK